MKLWLAACLFLSPALRAAPAPVDPALESALAPLAAQGLLPQRLISDTVKGVRLTVVLLRDDARSLDKLNVYALIKDKPVLVYTHPSVVDRLEISRSMLSDREFTNLLRDGSRTIVYHATTPGLNTRVLHVLRCTGARVRRIASFPDGRLKDIDEDGRMEIISRNLPLGRFFTVGCEDFQTMAQTASQLRISRWTDGRFVDVSAQFPGFFDEDIAGLEEHLALIPKEKRPGDYLGSALAVYYDYAAKGAQRQGWERLNALLKPPSTSVPRLTRCLEQVKADLRQKLAIPLDWK